MFVQTLNTPNPNSLKFLPGEKVSLVGPVEFTEKSQTSNELIRNILSVNGVVGIFLSDDFISVNKKSEKDWEEIKHIIISLINDFYSTGKKFVYENRSNSEENNNLDEIEKKIIKILETKIRPAVARDGGDIKFREYKKHYAIYQKRCWIRFWNLSDICQRLEEETWRKTVSKYGCLL